jgi:hypothetical protein
MDATSGEAKLESKILQKVLKVDPDGTYSMQSNTLAGTLEVSGEKLDMPKNSSVAVYKPTGEVVSISGDRVDQTIMRSQNLTMLKRPENMVKRGDTWTLTIKSDPASKSPSVQGTFTFDGEETIGSYQTLKVRSQVSEGDVPNPGSVIATFWVNKTDGSLVKEECKYTSMTFPGATAPLSGTLAMTRTDK